MGQRETGEHRVRLSRYVHVEARLLGQHPEGLGVGFVPAGEGRHDDAGVNGDQRRVCSRDDIPVSGVSSLLGTAATTAPAWTSVIFVASGNQRDPIVVLDDVEFFTPGEP